MQELKKQIQEAKITAKKEDESLVTVNQAAIKQVSHNKYGIGKVLKEDETIIEVAFEKYGVKEFIKAFIELTYL